MLNRGVLISLAVFPGAMSYATLRTYSRHHDAALAAILHDIWDATERNPQAVKDYESYLDSGFWNVMFHKPPHNALKRFGKVDVMVYTQSKLDESRRILSEMHQ